MPPDQPSFLNKARSCVFAGLLLLLVSSCATFVKNYPSKKPFVYTTNINVTGNFSKDTIDELESRLKGQLDDSMKSRSVSKVFWSTMKKPPVYDAANADKSIIFMKGLMKSLGFFQDTIGYDTTLAIVKGDQYRTTVNFNVKTGKLVRLDSISYNMKDTGLQALTMANQKETFLKKDDGFAKGAISLELDRLVDLYRNNGYLRFTKDGLLGLWDTLDVSLLDPALDPFEQLELLQKIKERRENPKANLEITLRPGIDSNKLIKYFVGNISIYPDFNQDTVGYTRKEVMLDGKKIIYYRRLFKPKHLTPNIYFSRGELYNQKKYIKTVNRFNALGAWGLVNIEQNWRRNTDTVDFNVKLSPAKKYSFTTNIEGSRNNTAISGNLLGIALNVGLQNRNFAKGANRSVTNIRYGIETGRDTITDVKFTQTRQISFSHSIYFPRPVPKFISAERTVLNFTAAATERRELYNLFTLNGSWGYEFQWKKSLFSLRLPNIEYSFLDPKQKLKDLFVSNPALKNIFTDGFISSITGGYTVAGGRKNKTNVFRANMEVSGMVSGLLNSDFLDTNLYRFLKTDGEFTRLIKYKKSSVAMRLFAGIGWEFNSTANPDKRNNLPFFKQYSGGGPNSMRAWQLRKLGPGSSKQDFATNPERYGDVQLEANLEYRFHFFDYAGVKFNAAVFTDIGNIWLLKKEAAPGKPEEVFNFSRFAKDLAVGAGVGLRVDFSFFVLRLDYAYKVKDPSPTQDNLAKQNKWFGYKFSQGDQFQLGINYPFIF